MMACDEQGNPVQADPPSISHRSPAQIPCKQRICRSGLAGGSQPDDGTPIMMYHSHLGRVIIFGYMLADEIQFKMTSLSFCSVLINPTGDLSTWRSQPT